MSDDDFKPEPELIEPGDDSGAEYNIGEDVARALIADIARHLSDHGATKWKLLQDRYVATGQISDRHFWRLVAEVKAGKPAQEILAHSVKLAKARAARQLPAAPSPNYIATGGPDALANIDFMSEFNELFADAKLLREWSSKVDEAGKRTIKSPQFFSVSMKLRVELLETQLKALREVYDLTRIQKFFDAVVAEVAVEAPECRDRIMIRLARLNAEWGFNANAGT